MFRLAIAFSLSYICNCIQIFYYRYLIPCLSSFPIIFYFPALNSHLYVAIFTSKYPTYFFPILFPTHSSIICCVSKATRCGAICWGSTLTAFTYSRWRAWKLELLSKKKQKWERNKRWNTEKHQEWNSMNDEPLLYFPHVFLYSPLKGEGEGTDFSNMIKGIKRASLTFSQDGADTSPLKALIYYSRSGLLIYSHLLITILK